MAFVFYPDDPRSKDRKYRKYRPKEPSWIAPEHQRMAKGMQRSRRVDEYGKFPDGPIGHLIVDKRPTVMVPSKPVAAWSL